MHYIYNLIINQTMRKIIFLSSMLCYFVSFSQNLPINFEGDVMTSDFTDFSGGTASVVANPVSGGINTSATVGRIVRNGGDIWAGSKIILTNDIDFSVLSKITMKVFTTAPIGTTIKFKLENASPYTAAEVDAVTTVSGTWETLEWVFILPANNLNEIVFMFDFGNVGDGSANSTFYFDDIEHVAGPPQPRQLSLPIDFESSLVADTDFILFSGAGARIIANPQMNSINTSDSLCEVIRDGGDFWAGCKIFLTDNLDFSSEWNLSMKFFTNAPIGTRLKLELENNDGIRGLDYLTTVSGEWETATWNFYGWDNNYDRINFLFDFGIVGDGSSTSTFLFDDLQQFAGPAIPDPQKAEIPIDFESSVVDSDFTNVFGGFASVISNPQVNSINPSAMVGQFVRSGGAGAPWAQSKLGLTEFMDLPTHKFITMKVFTYAPVGTILKLKIEGLVSGAANEKDVETTVSGEWATYSWDFTSGDPAIYDGLVFMFGYGTPNDGSANATFLIDDIRVENTSLNVQVENPLSSEEFKIYPNPMNEAFTISTENEVIKNVELFNLYGDNVLNLKTESTSVKINVSELAKGVYIVKTSTLERVNISKIVID